mgnify:CR=1 FL=1
MGICYRVFLMDEFNWEYGGFNRVQVVNEVQAVIPWAVLEADIPHLLIFNIEKTWPWDLVGKVTCDKIMAMRDANWLEFEDVQPMVGSPCRGKGLHVAKIKKFRATMKKEVKKHLWPRFTDKELRDFINEGIVRQ